MKIGKLSKTLNKWQFFAWIGKDVTRPRYWRWEIWCFSLLIMPIYGVALKKHWAGKQMYKGFIIGNSHKIPLIAMRKFRYIPFALPIKISFR